MLYIKKQIFYIIGFKKVNKIKNFIIDLYSFFYFKKLFYNLEQDLKYNEKVINKIGLNLSSIKRKLKSKKPALFLDRDGVINKDFGYVYKVKDLKYEKKIFKIAKYYYNKNYLIIVISNQSGVGRKFFTKKSLEIFNNKIKKDFIKKKIPLTDIYVCTHKPEDNCLCRKPKNLMIKKATRKWKVDLSKSVMIGDKKSDFLCAKKSNLKFYYKKTIDKKF